MLVLVLVLSFLALAERTTFVMRVKSARSGGIYSTRFGKGIVTKDGSFVMGGLGSETEFMSMAIAKLDSSGNYVFGIEPRMGDNIDAKSICETTDGDYLAVGYWLDSNPPLYGFMVKVSKTDGAIRWTRKLASPGNNIQALDCLSDGTGTIVVGKLEDEGFIAKVSDDGELMWSKNVSFEVTTVARKADGKLAVAGSAPGDNKLVVSLLSADGTTEWATKTKGSRIYPTSISFSSNGADILVGGYISRYGSNEGALLKLTTATGVLDWVKFFHRDGELVQVKGTKGISDGYLIAGQRGENNHKRPYFCKLHGTGAVSWCKTNSSELEEIGFSIEEMDDGKIVLFSNLEVTPNKWGMMTYLLDSNGVGCGTAMDSIGFTINSTTEVTGSDATSDFSSVIWNEAALTTETLTEVPVMGENSDTMVCEGKCSQYYFGDDCNVYSCGDGFSNETGKICNSGSGTCTTPGGRCKCSTNYYGEFCGVTQCGGYFSNETTPETICNGHGTCSTPGGTCQCTNDYTGLKCETAPDNGGGEVDGAVGIVLNLLCVALLLIFGL